MMLRKWQQKGHRPIILLGGGTTLIGDPSGKDKTRKMLSQEDIEKNKQSLTSTFEKFLSFEKNDSAHALLIDNTSWLKPLNFLDFLREVGPHLTLNRLLTFDSIKSRLDREQPLTYLEFNYMMLQAYDFYYLNREHEVFLQFGGSDQWGNMISGHELIRKKTGHTSCVFTLPLLTTADGKKMGKSEEGAIWLNEDLLSSYDYWQFWRNCDDRDTERFLKIYTDLSLEQIDDLKKKHHSEPNALKEILANEATSLLHGKEAARTALKASKALFSQGQSAAFEDLPHFFVTKEQLEKDNLVDILVLFELFLSKGACRKMIDQGGLKVDGEKVSDKNILLSSLKKLAIGEPSLISVGKKKHYYLKVQ
jgi:tyrosyl-tRNA synthetase